MKQSFKGPLDYIDVATRIVEFREKHPEGSLVQQDLQFIEFGGQAWVVYTAAAYRHPLDERPGIGTAWEPVPGKTNFTRDSELQNAETAAWGRAMVAALAVDTKKGIASSEEVRNRQEGEVIKPPTEAEKLSKALINGISEKEQRRAFVEEMVGHTIGSLAELTSEEITLVHAALAEQTAPFAVENQ